LEAIASVGQRNRTSQRHVSTALGHHPHAGAGLAGALQPINRELDRLTRKLDSLGSPRKPQPQQETPKAWPDCGAKVPAETKTARRPVAPRPSCARAFICLQVKPSPA